MPIVPGFRTFWTHRRAAVVVGASLIAVFAHQSAAQAEPPPPPPPAQADATPPPPVASEADKQGELGRDAYRTGNYAEALRLFERAFVLDDGYRWLYNMAKCKEKLAQYTDAVRLLERYLEHFRRQNPGREPTDLVDVQHLSRDLKQRAFEALPEVEIRSSPVGAQVLLGDGTTIGSTPVTTHIAPGRYKIVLKLTNYTDLEAELAVPQSGKVSLVFGMKSKLKRAGLALWANIRGAQVAVDGKVMAVTPFEGQLSVEPGRHQVTMTRTGYKPIEREVMVPEDKQLLCRFTLHQQTSRTSWRGYLGWPLLILGGLSTAGGAVAANQADLEYRGTPNFEQYAQLQNIGYVGGGSAAALGLALIIWDGVRENVPDDELVAGPLHEEGDVIRPLVGAEVGQ